MIHIMATCHSLRNVDGELLGDPLDVKMFQFTGWSFEEGDGQTSEHSNLGSGTIVPSVARPPDFFTPMNDNGQNPTDVGTLQAFQQCE